MTTPLDPVRLEVSPQPDAAPRPRGAHRAPRSAGSRIGGHFVALVSGAAAVRLIALASQIVLARLLGPESMGSLALAQALLVFSGVFTDGGLTTLSLREMVREPARRSHIATVTMVVQLALATTGALAMAGVALAAPWDHRTTLVVISFCPALVCSALNMAYILKSVEMMGTVALSRVVATAMPAMLSVALVVATHSPVWVGVATVLGLLVNDVLIYVVLRRRIGFGFVGVTSREVRATARSGFPMLVTQALLIVPSVAGTITVYLIEGARAAGLFQAAWQLSYAALMVAALVIDAIYPELVRRAAAGDEAFGRFVKVALALAVRVTLPAAVVASFAATPLMHLLFGSRYAEADTTLRIAVWIAPLGFCWVILGHALVARNAERTMTRMSFVVTAFTIVAVPLATWQVGPSGTAAALVGASLLQAILYGSAACLRPAGALMTVARQLPYAIAPALAAFGGAMIGLDGLVWTTLIVGLATVAYEFAVGAPTITGLRSMRTNAKAGLNA